MPYDDLPNDGWGKDRMDNQDDPLAPARGCLVAMALGALIWIALFVIYKVVTAG